MITLQLQVMKADISQLKSFNEEKDFTEELMAATKSPGVNPNQVARAEFIGMKQIIGRQQLSIVKLEQALNEL